jgi:hypothetical protein
VLNKFLLGLISILIAFIFYQYLNLTKYRIKLDARNKELKNCISARDMYAVELELKKLELSIGENDEKDINFTSGNISF